MPRAVDSSFEAEIDTLKGQGLSVRQIARELRVAASTVSRILRKEPTRVFLAQVTDLLEMLEQQMRVCLDCLFIFSHFAGHASPAKISPQTCICKHPHPVCGCFRWEINSS